MSDEGTSLRDILGTALLFSYLCYITCMSILHYVCLIAHVYVLMRHDNHVCYIIADLAMSPLSWGVHCPALLSGSTGFPRPSQRRMRPQGLGYIRRADPPGYERTSDLRLF